MWKLLPLLTLALCAAGVSAQSRHFTAPAGYLEVTGGGRHGAWGYYMDGRQQYGDPSLPKVKLMLTQVDLRTQTQATYAPTLGMGRRWSAVSLKVGHTDCSKLTRTFSANFKGSAATVFNGSVSLKSHTSGIPIQSWGNAGSFPFAKAFAYDGSSDLLLDWSFTGGRLANGNTFLIGAFYMTDSPSSLASVTVGPDLPRDSGNRYLPHAPRAKKIRCADSGQSNLDAFAYLQATFYSDNYPVTSLRGKARVDRSETHFTQKSGAVIGALTAFGSNNGVVVPGARCYPLHVNMSIPLAVLAKTATIQGFAGNYFPSTPLNYSSNLAGIPLYFQAAWQDSATNQLALTIASRIMLPRKPGDRPIGCHLYEFLGTNGKVGPIGPLRSIGHNMLERFTFR